MVIFFNFSPTSNHLHPLQVENRDSNSRLVVDGDDNCKFRLERVKPGFSCFSSLLSLERAVLPDHGYWFPSCSVISGFWLHRSSVELDQLAVGTCVMASDDTGHMSRLPDEQRPLDCHQHR